MKTIAGCLVAVAISFVFSYEAAAHGLELYVTQSDASSMSGRVTYDDDVPLAGTEVKVLSESGDTLTTVRTATNGNFTIPLFEETVTIEVSTPDGHRITEQIEYEDLDGSVAERQNSSASQEIDLAFLSQKITGLEERIHEYENRIRFRDILGGIGYIVGVMGLIGLMKRRKSL
jgi:nickel transport protein